MICITPPLNDEPATIAYRITLEVATIVHPYTPVQCYPEYAVTPYSR
jgi:hypothetical protein